jgi:hypothetical protein
MVQNILREVGRGMITVTFDDWSMLTPRSVSDMVEVLMTGTGQEISGGRISIEVPAVERDVEEIGVSE